MVRFMKKVGAKPFIADGCIFGLNSKEPLGMTKAANVAREEGAVILNLEEAQSVHFEVSEPYAVNTFTLASYAAEADCIVFLPVMKNPMLPFASLMVKNMMGCFQSSGKDEV